MSMSDKGTEGGISVKLVLSYVTLQRKGIDAFHCADKLSIAQTDP
jgi:hypothetical protein